MLWDQLVKKSGWEMEKLWEKVSFGPSKFLNQTEEKLTLNSNRWLLFDPDKEWYQSNEGKPLITATNQPIKDKKIVGKVIDCGKLIKLTKAINRPKAPASFANYFFMG